MAAAAARRPLMASVKVIWNNHNTVYDLPQFVLRTWRCFHPNWQPASDKWKQRVKLGTGGLSNGTNPDLQSSPFLLHIQQFNFIFIMTEQNLPVCRVGFHRMKEEVWLRYQRPATNRFPLRRRLRPSDVNLCSDGSGKTNSADTFKDSRQKRRDSSGTTDGCIYRTDVAINDRLCSDTLRVKTYSNDERKNTIQSPC